MHAILDNYAAHKTPEVRRWLARHRRWTASSWLNAVEGFFAKLSRRRLKRGVFCSVMEVQAAINRFVQEHNTVRGPSYGGQIPTRSSPRVPEGSKRWSHSTREAFECGRSSQKLGPLSEKALRLGRRCREARLRRTR